MSDQPDSAPSDAGQPNAGQPNAGQPNAGQQAFSVISKTIQGESSWGQTPRLGAETVSQQLDAARRHPMVTGLVTLALTAAIGFVVAAGYRSLRRASRS